MLRHLQKYRRRRIRLQNPNLPFFENGIEILGTNFAPRNKILLMNLLCQMACKHQCSVLLGPGNTLVLPNLKGVPVIVDNHFSNQQPNTNLLMPMRAPARRKICIERNYSRERR